MCGVYVVVVWGRVVVDNTFDGYELIVRRSPWPSGPCILSSWWGLILVRRTDVLGWLRGQQKSYTVGNIKVYEGWVRFLLVLAHDPERRDFHLCVYHIQKLADIS